MRIAVRRQRGLYIRLKLLLTRGELGLGQTSAIECGQQGIAAALTRPHQRAPAGSHTTPSGPQIPLGDIARRGQRRGAHRVELQVSR